MRPLDIQHIGGELAIKWDEWRRDVPSLETLRRACPCAGCKGERDVMGNLHKGPDIPLTPAAFQLRGVAMVGSYAVQPTWADGHASGLYPFEFLRKLAS